MNIASRLQGAAPPNGVAVSEATYFQTRDTQGYRVETAMLKGIGETQVYLAHFGAEVVCDVSPGQESQ